VASRRRDLPRRGIGRAGRDPEAAGRSGGDAVAESSLTLPTYEEELPDVNPRFDLFAAGPFLIYPYTTRTNLTDRSTRRLAHARARERVT
jgi:hypothetical protein